ncbi:MAG: GIY-YIG nuclease family protein, partial [Bacteroidetes bacterium]|nr:GIY-YIG nuclease family protein [Bacteroidota bacterium]
MASATLKIFLVNGNPKRLRTAELSNWTGKAVAGPRSEIEGILKRDESKNPGVYFLTGIDPETNGPSIYIGEAESIHDRIKGHLGKDFWNHIVFFISKDENMTKAHIRYLEGRLIDIAKSSERATIVNSQGSGSKLPESDREDMEVFLDKMQQVLPVLGIEVFVPMVQQDTSTDTKKLLTCKIKALSAQGYLTPNGIVVISGSQAVLKERASAKNYPSVLNHRNDMIKNGHLKHVKNHYVFQKDVEFTSPSAAATVIH